MPFPPFMTVVFVVVGFALLTLTQAVRIAQEYERGVIFRLGRLVGVRGPGLIFIIPFIGPLAGTLVSSFVAPMMLAPKYSVPQSPAAKIILPAVAAVYVVSGGILWFGLPAVMS